MNQQVQILLSSALVSLQQVQRLAQEGQVEVDTTLLTNTMSNIQTLQQG